MAMHRQNLAEATVKLKEAEAMLRKLEEGSMSHPDVFTNVTKIAYQEFVEARVLLALVEGKSFPSPRELGVPTIPYVLGLADAIGEFRRTAVEALKASKLREAESCLQAMEEIFQELVPLEEFYTLIPEIRRKMDIARRLIESTLGEVSSEARRSSLESALRLLEERLLRRKRRETKARRDSG